MFWDRKTIATHNNDFHVDDVFAVATICLFLENRGKRTKIIRTRNESILGRADYVVDIGGIYDEENNRFDHHQVGGAGTRDNGIEYAAFGLVWKKYGKLLCRDGTIVDYIDNKLVASIDATDNGQNTTKQIIEGVTEYGLHNIISILFRPSKKGETNDKQFLKAVKWAKEIISREINHTKRKFKDLKYIRNAYNSNSDKKLIIIEEYKSRSAIFEALQDYEEVLFVVSPDEGNLNWKSIAMRKKPRTFENRKNFPSHWAGLRNGDLAKITGVSNAVFCHRSLFLAVAGSKQGAIELAKLAIEN